MQCQKGDPKQNLSGILWISCHLSYPIPMPHVYRSSRPSTSTSRPSTSHQRSPSPTPTPAQVEPVSLFPEDDDYSRPRWGDLISNVSTVRLKWRSMLWQMRCRKTFYVASAHSQWNTKDSIVWLVEYTLCNMMLQNVPHFVGPNVISRWSDKRIVGMSIAEADSELISFPRTHKKYVFYW